MSIVTTHLPSLNPGIAFDSSLLKKVWDDEEVKKLSKNLVDTEMTAVNNSLKERTQLLLQTVSCIDLTTLAGDDTSKNVGELCAKALNPVKKEVLEKLGAKPIQCGAVCVYPARVGDAVDALKRLQGQSHLPIASVAAGFPAGQTFLSVKLLEIKEAVATGATEIDIVISRPQALAGKWEEMYQEIKQLRAACGPNAHMKTILAVGELTSFTMVYAASMVAMMAGSDFIKTSTGKEVVNATIPVGYVMASAIKDYYSKTGFKVGIKPAGGLKTTQDALDWLVLVRNLLGEEWMNPNLFRIGASSLLGDVEKELTKLALGGK